MIKCFCLFTASFALKIKATKTTEVMKNEKQFQFYELWLGGNMMRNIKS